MFCMKCGYELPNEANFCLKCGNPTKTNVVAPETVYYLKIHWWCEPNVSASTNQESLSLMIFKTWKSKASMPELVKYSQKNSEYTVSYSGEKFRDALKLNKYSREISDFYDILKNYAISNSWILAEPEIKHRSDSFGLSGLDCILTKKS